MKFLKLTFFVFSIFNGLYCATAGSDSSVGLPQAHFNFPAGENDTNKISNYAVMEDGFTLEDATTTCSFSSIFPVSGRGIYLNNGKLFLFSDLVFTNTSKLFFSDGKIYGNYYSINIAEKTEELSYSFTLDSTGLVLNGNLNLKEEVFFTGDTFIDGGYNSLILDAAGRISVAPGGTLVLENVIIEGVRGRNINCIENDSSIIMKNCELKLSRDFNFDTGTILFQSEVTISGTSQFNYATSIASTIDSNTVLKLTDGIIFNYAPVISNSNLIYMNDETSWLYLDSCSLHSTETGMSLTRGTLLIDNGVTFSSIGTSLSESICFGDGTLVNDLSINFLSGCQVDVYGPFSYKNTN